VISYTVEHADQKLELGTDESYTLKIKQDENGSMLKVEITAKTYFGCRHALETLSQLVVFDELKGSLVMPSSVTIEDEPAFSYRGVLLDTCRHFLPVWMIKKTITAMSYVKMNRLHLHLTDTGSFPLQIPSQPNMTRYGAYSATEMYSPEDIADLVQFGREHGVQIIPEVDTPAHAHYGWDWGVEAGLGELVICRANTDSQGLEFPSGQMNIVNENVYTILGDVYNDVIEMFDSSVFHLGGDEVLVGSDNSWAGCYNVTSAAKPILDYIAEHKLDRGDKQTFYGLWQQFTKRAQGLVEAAYVKSGKSHQKIMQWGGFVTNVEPAIFNLFEYPDLVKETLPPSDFMIQVWDNADGSVAPWLTKMGYSVVLAHQDYLYLDCGGAGWEQPGGYWCQPKHEWYRMYDYIPKVLKLWDIAPDSKEASLIEGAEAILWGERADLMNLENLIWPRTAALAERLWSNPSSNWYDADPRMQIMRERLVQRNISAEALQPEWCIGQAPHACTMDSKKEPVLTHKEPTAMQRPDRAGEIVV